MIRHALAAFALGLLPCVSPVSANTDVEAMLRMFAVDVRSGRVLAEEAAKATHEPLQRELQVWAFAHAHDPAEMLALVAEAITPQVTDADVARFRELATGNTDEALAALLTASPDLAPADALRQLSRRQRRAFATYDEDGAAERLLSALASPDGVAALMNYLARLYCRAAAEEPTGRFSSLEDEACAASRMFSDRQPLPDEVPTASDDALAVVTLMNLPGIVAGVFTDRLARTADEGKAAFLRTLKDYLDVDELAHFVGAEFDRRATKADLAEVAAFARSPAGQRLMTEIRSRSLAELPQIEATLPPDLRREVEAFGRRPATRRVVDSMTPEEYEEIGVRYGRLLICRAAPTHLPEEYDALVAGGVCRRAEPAAPAPNRHQKSNAGAR